jgi:hypothetical protein
VQGTTDVQTMVEDAKVLAAAKKDSKLVIIEGMNHVLKKASTQMEQLKTYYDPSVPLAPHVIEEIATFLQQVFAKPPEMPVPAKQARNARQDTGPRRSS